MTLENLFSLVELMHGNKVSRRGVASKEASTQRRAVNRQLRVVNRQLKVDKSKRKVVNRQLRNSLPLEGKGDRLKTVDEV